MLFYFISLFIGLGLGLGVGLWMAKVNRQRRIQAAEADAEAIVLDAQDRFEELMSEARERATEYEDKIWSQNEKEIGQLETRVQEKEDVYRKKRSELDRSFHKETKEIQKRSSELGELEKQASARQTAYDEKKAKLRSLKKDMIAKLQSIVGGDAEAIKTQVQENLENSFHVEAKKKAGRIEDEARANAETIAKRIISIALGRFSRASCTERGIGSVEFTTPEQKAKLCGPNDANLKIIEQACGVDLVITEDNTIAVAGFDPVRRELTTNLFE